METFARGIPEFWKLAHQLHMGQCDVFKLFEIVVVQKVGDEVMKKLPLKILCRNIARVLFLGTIALSTFMITSGCGKSDPVVNNPPGVNNNPYNSNAAYQQAAFNPLNSGTFQFGQQCQVAPGVPGIALGYNCVQQGQLPCIIPSSGQVGVYTSQGCQYAQTTIVYACRPGDVMTPVAIQNQLTQQMDTLLLCQSSCGQNSMLSWNSTCYNSTIFPY